MKMILISSCHDGIITVATLNGSVAELSEMLFEVGGYKKPVYYFHRIKVKPELEGTGEGKELMKEVCRHADALGATIFNELNPYGKRDMDSLKEFFKASGFTEDMPNIMVRLPKKE
jgi:GNAT superfamily N-acetyltransferase